MAVQLEKIVPVGRFLDEYLRMFNLTPIDLQGKILSAGDGPASFNAEGTALGYRIKSIDPIYCFSAEQIQAQFDAVIDDIIEQVKKTPADWVWDYHGSPEGLRQNRQQAMQRFCSDYELGKQQGRYEVGELPQLRFGDGEYDLGLSSHFLLLYSDHLDLDFHLQSVLELLRICREVRIFPLLTLALKPSPHLQPMTEKLQQLGFDCQLETVAYELQRGGNRMLRVTRAAI